MAAAVSVTASHLDAPVNSTAVVLGTKPRSTLVVYHIIVLSSCHVDHSIVHRSCRGVVTAAKLVLALDLRYKKNLWCNSNYRGVTLDWQCCRQQLR